MEDKEGNKRRLLSAKVSMGHSVGLYRQLNQMQVA